MPLSKRYFGVDDVYLDIPQYDIHVVGSDQVWNIENGMGERNYYFLGFLRNDEKRISYASSFGNTNISAENNEHLKKLLSNFSAISVRESDAVELIEKTCGLKATQTLDPTLLLNASQWQNVSGIDKPLIKGEYVLYYGFDRSKECGDMIAMMRKKLNLPIVAISVSTTSPYRFDYFVQAAGPREFVNLFCNAAYVITSSFHGLAFSLNFQRNVFVVRHGTRMSRMESLLTLLDINNRIVSTKEELIHLIENDPQIDYYIPSIKLQEERQKSINWLKDALLV